jgi:multiple sugar transport system substrate-binding protein
MVDPTPRTYGRARRVRPRRGTSPAVTAVRGGGSSRPRAGRGTRTALTAAAAAIGLTGCSAAQADETVTLDYWLWDANQLPAYQQCIDQFEEANPDIEVRLAQYGYDDYWTKLTAGFVAGTGPDVFTNHLSRFPEYAERDLLVNLDELDSTAGFSADEFQEGLTDLWAGEDGEPYGIPKDFDAIGLFFNEEMLADAGLTPEDLEDLDWNPEDGGSYEDVLARLTVDANGVRGDEEGFDPDNVETYGLASNGSGNAAGQTTWSWLAASTGWTFTDADTWGEEYNFDDPRLQETLAWLFGLVDKGYMASFQEVGTEPNMQQQIGSGSAALAPDGSWMINTYAQLDGVGVDTAPLPEGPVGNSVTMYNGLADSISAQSENPDEAGLLVEHLGSAQCQNTVGDAAVVLPARPESTEQAVNAFAEDDIDVAPFTEVVEEGNTLYFPVTRNFGAIEQLLTPIMDELYIGGREPDTLTEVNDRVNGLLE